MTIDVQALDRIRQAMGHYLRREITQGEAVEDVLDVLDACGLDPSDGTVRPAEARSWAPANERSVEGSVRDKSDASAEPVQTELRL